MSKRRKACFAAVIGFMLLGIFHITIAKPPTKETSCGRVFAWIDFHPDADLELLAEEIAEKGVKVISLAPEGKILVSVPPGQMKDLEFVYDVEDVEPAALPENPGPQVPLKELPPPGVKLPSAERLSELEEETVLVTYIEPNDLAIKRGQLKGKGKALGKGKGKKGGGDVISVMSVGSADNSTSQYFPPIRSQGGQGSCTAWATGYYWATYTQAKDENLDASSGNNDYICSPAFVYNLINGGYDAGAWPADAFSLMNKAGCSNWSLMPYSDSDLTTWPSEAAWVQGLNNRTQTLYHIDGYDDAGVELVKLHLDNGNIAATTTEVYTNWYSALIDDYTRGIDSGVLFSHAGESNVGAHAMTIVGYDDSKSYYDGSSTKYGAFLIANSWGTGWGTYNSTGTGSRGFMWVAYDYFKANNYCFGYGEYCSDRADYRPYLYAVSGLNHNQRGRIAYRGGVGSDPENPDWISPMPINEDGGNSVSISDTKRVAVDLTDGMSYVTDENNVYLFSRLWVDTSASTNGTITSADFYHDFNEDGSYGMASSTDPTVTVTPGTRGHATVNFNGTPTNNVPVADAGADKSVRMDEPITLDGSGSTDADEDPLTYTWAFGDGSAVATGVTVTHIYTAVGPYTVTLTVDDGTDSDTDNATVTVLPDRVPLADWLKGNVHFHTTNSDGSATLEEMVGIYRDSSGCDFSGVGDHDYISNADQYTASTFLGVNGVEATGGGPHVFGFGMSSTGSYSPGSGLQGHINNILADGGIPMVAHPEWSYQYMGYPMSSLITGMTGCKHLAVMNYYCEALWGWGISETIWDTVLTDGTFTYGVSEGDDHGPGNKAGRTYNMVGAEDLTVADLKTAFNSGDFYACYAWIKWGESIHLTEYEVTGNEANDTITIDTDYGDSIQFIGSSGTVLQTTSSDYAVYTITGNEGYVRIKITNTDGDTTWTQPVMTGGGPPPPPPPPPIEDYEGYEPITTGGEGGQVQWVTNLNSSGAGSLNGILSGLDGTPTIIKFSVGGGIYSTIGVYKPNITIAGETAPSPGITIWNSGRGMEINTHDIIVRHMRFRNAGSEGIQIFGDYNLIIDHCSVSGTGDGAIDINGGTHHIIVSRCLLADCVEVHRSYGIDAALHHNLYTWNNRRQPKIYKAGPRYDFRNNVIEYWTNTGTNIQLTTAGVNIIKNYYGPPAPGENWSDGFNITADSSNIYISGNYNPGEDMDSQSDRSTPVEEPDVMTMDAGAALYLDVHRNCGALPRDSIDESWAGPAVNREPVAVAGFNQTVYEDHDVTFDGSGSYDYDMDPLTYTWDFGDGTTAVGMIVTTSYDLPDTYTVTLTVDDGQDSDTDTCTATVLPYGEPVADAGEDQSVTVNVTMTLDGSGSYDPESSPLTYTWDFGDGSAVDTGETVTHVYTVTGVYTVTLTVDDGNYSDVDNCIVEVLPVGYPHADAGEDQTVYVDLTMTLDGSGSSDPDEDPLTYTWELGDGSMDAGVSVTHVYTASGAYTVTLAVNDGTYTDTDICIITARTNAVPVAVIDSGDQTVKESTVVTLSGSGSSDADGDELAYTWDLGDGTTADGMNITHSYTISGTYTCTLTVYDEISSDTDTAVITVNENYAPIAIIASGNDDVKVNTEVAWDGSASYDPEEDAITYTWQMGDGTVLAGVTVTHVYTVTGTYTCTLTVYDYLYSGSDADTITVHPNYAPEPDAGDDKTIHQYEQVAFDASDSEDDNDDPLTFTWDFGDGLTAVGVTTSHRYSDIGDYTVTLTASDGELSATDTCEVKVVEIDVTWYYVDKNLGNDSNDGKKNQPWQTIQKAADTIGAGEGVIVMPATYTEMVTVNDVHGSSGFPIVFKAANDEGRVIIDATGYDKGFHITKGYVVVDGFEITGATEYGVNFYYGKNGVVANCHLYGNDMGIRCYYGGSNDHLWVNNVVYDNADTGLRCAYGAGAGTVVRNCTVYGNGGDGIAFVNGWGAIDCIVTDNAGYGINASSAKLSMYNDVWNNTSGNYNGGISAGAGCISSNPEYTDAANDDFTLEANSPCIDADYDGEDMGYTYPDAYTNTEPVADAGEDYEVFAAQVITFDGSGSYDPNNDDITYTWNLGDGSTAAGVSVTHGYASTGTYTVTLTVSDGSLSDTDTAVVAVVSGITGDYYVATYGDDSNNGSSGAPFATIQKAADTVAAGDIVVVRSGTYVEKVVISTDGTAASPIKFKADTILGEVSVDGTGRWQCFEITGAYIVLDGFFTHTCTYSPIKVGTNDADGVVIRNCVATNGGSHGIMADSGDDVTIENCLAYDNNSNGIYLTNNADGAVIRNCTLDNNGLDGIHTGTSDATVDDCIITNNTQWGIDTYGTVAVTIDYSDVWNNTSGSYDDTTKITEGGNCISSDPDFEKPQEGDYHLEENSPCEDAASDGYDMGYRYPPDTNNAPIADAGADESVYIDQVITFDGSDSRDPDYDEMTYTWDFGNGSTAVDCAATNSYTETGAYTVTLTVSDGALSDTDTCVITVVSGATGDYYVATYGDDNNAGTSAAPFATIEKASDTVAAGDTVIVRAGTYAERVTHATSGSSGSEITFQADSGVGDVVIDGTTNSFVNTGAYVVLDGFICTGTTEVAVYFQNNAGDECVIKNLIIHDTGTHGIRVNYADNITIENCLIYDNPQNGIYLYSDANGATITNCTLYGNGYDGIHSRTSDATVEDCIITNNGQWGIDTYSTVSITTDYNDVWNNTSGSYDDTNKISVGENSISSDPDFVDAANGDFHLNTGSPCIDADSDGDDMGYLY